MLIGNNENVRVWFDTADGPKVKREGNGRLYERSLAKMKRKQPQSQIKVLFI